MSRVVNSADVRILTESERKARRMAKFAQNDKLTQRALRFGNAVTTADASKPSTGDKVAVDSEKLKKRAERFGVVSETVKKIDEKERLMKRKQRFEGMSSSASNATTEEAKRKRLERFSMNVNTSVEAKKVS